MELAKAIGIDAFALNCASIDSYTDKQLEYAYRAAEEVDFQVFISFDFAYWSNGDTARITSIMQTYASHPGQFQYNGAALVSTFVGDSFNWGPVKNAVDHPIFAVPNLQDPNWASQATTSIDGAFSWYAWPTDGGNSIIQGPMTTIWDDRFIQNLGDKVYMARKLPRVSFCLGANRIAVSPWFSTHFNTKNWVFICEDLPHLRWEQMLEMQPELIEIVSWNDYGESHYIGPYSENHSDDGAAQWAKDFPHDAWRILSKPYIAAYKAGEKTPTVESDQLVYWYRPTPKGVTCSKDPLGPPNGVNLLADSVFVTTLLTEPATLTVTSGSQQSVSVEVDAGIVTTDFPMDVGVQSFSVRRNGEEILGGDGGLDIQDHCDYYNFNVYVGSF
ncbi:glycoside hydrolase [Aspergillus varians]